jgi:sigma-54 dependent transcriptional regulator, acetoin dehydrogenase operon transcriptional activator AcoR
VLATKAAASGIWGLVVEHEAELHRFLLERLANTARFAISPALAIDRNGMVICASEPARRLLGSADTRLEGRLLTELRGAEPLARSLADAEAKALTLNLDSGVTDAVLEPVCKGGNQAGLLVWLDPRTVSRPVSLSIRTEWRSHHSFSELVGRSPQFETAKQAAMRVARTDLPVMLEGETGTGKELFAHAIHAASSRRDAPFVTLNCGTIPQELIAAELFGYEKGAFTGASTTGRRGKFVQAHGGTLFLDEITETTAALQVSLLRALEDRAVVPVGAERATSVDVRVIAATNRNLKQALREGALRRDLYYRLKGVLITLPPLRERTADIELFIEHFLARFGANVSLSSDAADLLLRYSWPGNVRELRSVLTSASLMAQGSMIQLSDLDFDETEAAPQAGSHLKLSASRKLEEAELFAVRQAMDECGGNVKEAAKALGIARSSLYRRLRRFNLQRSSAWK